MIFDKKDGNAQITTICMLALIVFFMMLLFGMMQLQTEFVFFKTNECFEEAVLAANCQDVTAKNSSNAMLFSCDDVSDCSLSDCAYSSSGTAAGTMKAYEAAKKRFVESLKCSLSLNAGLVPEEKSCLKELTLSDFRIYNVMDSEIWECDGETVKLHDSGEIPKTPDGRNEVTRSGIYAEISYKISGFTAKSEKSFSLFAGIRN